MSLRIPISVLERGNLNPLILLWAIARSLFYKVCPAGRGAVATVTVDEQLVDGTRAVYGKGIGNNLDAETT